MRSGLRPARIAPVICMHMSAGRYAVTIHADSYRVTEVCDGKNSSRKASSI
jgi:hypothetical protein